MNEIFYCYVTMPNLPNELYEAANSSTLQTKQKQEPQASQTFVENMATCSVTPAKPSVQGNITKTFPFTPEEEQGVTSTLNFIIVRRS